MNRKRILVIEDDDNVRSNIATLLQEEDYDVITAVNGNDGIEKAKEFLPNLIVCDILMPSATGYDVLKELSTCKKARSIPFIFLTAKVELSDIRFGMELGADDYLFKPFKGEELLNSIRSRLNKREVIIADHIEEEKCKPKQEKVKRYDLDEKLFITVNGKPMFLVVGEIKYITTDNECTSVKLTDGKSVLIRRSIKSWENSLPEKTFLRIHRCTIVNMNFIVKMEKWHNASMIIYLKGINESFIISKRYSAKIRGKK